MKSAVKAILLNLFSLWILASTLGIISKNELRSLAIAAVALAAMDLVVKPIINLLLLPINMVTFGLLGWVSSLIVVYLTTVLVEDFGVSELATEPFRVLIVHFPAIHLGFWGTMVFLTAMLVITKKLISDVMK